MLIKPQLLFWKWALEPGLIPFTTALESMVKPIEINYNGIDAWAVKANEIEALQYSDLLRCEPSFFDAIHKENWGEKCKILPHFKLLKRIDLFSNIRDTNAFGPRVQPEIWKGFIFENMFQPLRPNGVLVTYCAKGSMRPHLRAVGFEVERLPGPAGKREMLRANKI